MTGPSGLAGVQGTPGQPGVKGEAGDVGPKASIFTTLFCFCCLLSLLPWYTT